MPVTSTDRTPISIMHDMGGHDIILSIPRIIQDQSFWCWAACTNMVLRFNRVTSFRQCDFASFIFSPNACCAAPAISACNDGCDEDQIKRVYNQFGIRCSLVKNMVPFSVISQQTVDNKTPVQVGFAWNKGGTHVALVTGCGVDAQGQYVVLMDPWYQSGRMRFADLQTGGGKGRWIRTWTNIAPTSTLKNMASITPLHKATIEKVAKELPFWIPNVVKSAASRNFQIADSMEVCMIGLEDISDPGKDAQSCCQTTGTWHIQVAEGRDLTSFARITCSSPDDTAYIMNSFFESDIAAAIDRGLQKIDEDLEDPAVVRLMEIPAFLLTGFVLETRDELRVLVVHKPDAVEIPELLIMSFDRMRDILQTQRPIEGLQSRPDPRSEL